MKGRHSIFYQSSVDHLIQVAGTSSRLILCGQVTEQCIQYSALDAYMRGYEVVVPRDAVAHINPEWAEAAFGMMEKNMHADLTPVADGALALIRCIQRDMADEGTSQSMRALLRLRQMVFDGEFAPGTRMAELPLVERLGVSRTPLRLALRRSPTRGCWS